MSTTQSITVIKGCPLEKWDDVMQAQHGPFIYICNNGSHWAGEDESDLEVLYDRLDQTELDPTWEKYGNFIELNPCQGVENPNFMRFVPEEEQTEKQWIDGPRLFDVEPVWHFNGNFYRWSHGFSIYTNVQEVIDTLTTKIRANQQTDTYQAAKVSCTKW